MTNSLTGPIANGTSTSLRDYLMSVGRSFGFAVLQRDEDLSEPVRLDQPGDNYHRSEVERLRGEIERAEAWTTLGARAASRTAFADAYRDWLTTRDREAAERERYESMLARVEAWNPDPLVEPVREAALKHLLESLSYLGVAGEEMLYYPEPQFLPGEEYRAQVLREARTDLAYHEEEAIKEKVRAAERNRYIEAFLRSLPNEEAT